MEFFIEENFYKGTMDVYAFEKNTLGRTITFQDAKGELVQEILKSGMARTDEIKPLVRIPIHNWQDFIDAVTKKTAPTKGKFVDGKLEGTERHLLDLQKIVNKLLKL